MRAEDVVVTDAGDIVVHLDQDENLRRVRFLLPSEGDDALRRALDALVMLTANASTLRAIEGRAAVSGSLREVLKVLEGLAYGTYELGLMEHTFETPNGTLTERRLFERLAQGADVAERAMNYARQLNPSRIRHGLERYLPCRWHDVGFPAGCFAVIPYALRHAAHITMLVEHMEGCDGNADTFHSRLVRVLWETHGWREETVDFLARRATYLCAQAGQRDLLDAAIDGQLIEHLEAAGEVERFVERIRTYAAFGSPSAQYEDQLVQEALELLAPYEPERRAVLRAQRADMNERFPQRNRWRSLAPGEWDDLAL